MSNAALSPSQFLDWFRAAAPYIHAFRGKTFVIAFGGEVIEAGLLNSLVQDIAILQALGIRLVIAHGSRPQVNAQLALKNLTPQFENDIRITNDAALECAKEAAGEIRLDIEALFSQGLPNTPMQNASVRIVSGNFVVARPLGVINGVDYHHTGVVRKIDNQAIESLLAGGHIVLLSPLGFSPTGGAFNLSVEDVATRTAIALNADKLFFIAPNLSLNQNAMTQREAEKLLQTPLAQPARDFVAASVKACAGGVERVHLLPMEIDGACLLEVFTHDGVGTMITEEALESLREASVEDVGAILQLIEPLEADGTLVKRGREKIEQEIAQFSVLEHDGVIFGCAALYTFTEKNMAEMACLTVAPNSQNTGDGARILAHIEDRARRLGIKQLFVLTTRTMHWFLKRGFTEASVEALPQDRQKLYNWQRKSHILIKNI